MVFESHHQFIHVFYSLWFLAVSFRHGSAVSTDAVCLSCLLTNNQRYDRQAADSRAGGVYVVALERKIEAEELPL